DEIVADQARAEIGAAARRRADEHVDLFASEGDFVRGSGTGQQNQKSKGCSVPYRRSYHVSPLPVSAAAERAACRGALIGHAGLLASGPLQELRMVFVEIVDETAVIDFPQHREVPERQRMDPCGIAVLLVLLQRFLID